MQALLFITRNRIIRPKQTTLNCCRCKCQWSTAIKNASSTHKALQIYSQMRRESLPPDSFSLLFTLRSCSALRNVAVNRQLHSQIIKLGFRFNVFIATSLLYCYAVTSRFDCCLLFDEMPERNTVTWNTMITAYSRWGSVEKARSVFDKMPTRDVGSWSAMITAYVDHGNWDHGLAMFREIVAHEDIKPNEITVGSVLTGCARMGSLGLLVGKSIHGLIVKNGWETNVEIGTVLVDMYAKCSLLNDASMAFSLISEKNVRTWTALICGLAKDGSSQETLAMFRLMLASGPRPNEMTFTGVLNACAHTGLVEEGRKCFKMIENYGVKPNVHHYGCMVDLFRKAGMLEEAYDVIKTMKSKPNAVIWSSFLSACKEHKRFGMAESVIEQVLSDINPRDDAGVYTLISDLYASNDRWNDAERVRHLMLNQHVRKARGSSFIRT